MTKTRKLFLFPALIVFIVFVIWLFVANRPLPLNERYRTEKLEKTNVTQTVSASGTLNPVVLINVGTQVSGTVTKLYVDFNDKVTKGQLLLELDRSLLEAQAAQSSANIANVRANLELAIANEARNKSLVDKHFISQQALDQSIQARKSAEAQLKQAEAAAKKDQVNLAYTQIRSPVSGVVVDRVVDLGQTVAASLQTPTLIKIAQDLSEMRIDSSFAEADIGKIRVGQKVRFTVDAWADRNFVGEVQQIRLNPTILQNVVTYNVRISLENPDEILLPGMTAYVNIEIAHQENVFAVPNAALRFKPVDEEKSSNKTAPRSNATEGGKNREQRQKREGKNTQNAGTIYVLENDKIRKVAVQIGINDNRQTEVLSDELQEGALIIVGELTEGKNDKPKSVGFRLF